MMLEAHEEILLICARFPHLLWFLALAYVTWQSLKNWQKNLMPVAIAYTPYMLHTST